MRRNLPILKGGHPGTSPWCTWVNDTREDDNIGTDWRPPPPPSPTGADDESSF
jgi:hypothetical protein